MQKNVARAYKVYFFVFFYFFFLHIVQLHCNSQPTNGILADGYQIDSIFQRILIFETQQVAF